MVGLSCNALCSNWHNFHFISFGSSIKYIICTSISSSLKPYMCIYTQTYICRFYRFQVSAMQFAWLTFTLECTTTQSSAGRCTICMRRSALSFRGRRVAILGILWTVVRWPNRIRTIRRVQRRSFSSEIFFLCSCLLLYYNFALLTLRLNVLEQHRSDGLDMMGAIKPSLALCVFGVFVLVYFSLWKGVRSSGKVVWVTALAPYVVLLILLARGVTLPGAADGIRYYLTPEWHKLKNSKVGRRG